MTRDEIISAEIVLPPGTKIEFLPGPPPPSFREYQRELIEQIARGLGIPANLSFTAPFTTSPSQFRKLFTAFAPRPPRHQRPLRMNRHQRRRRDCRSHFGDFRS